MKIASVQTVWTYVNRYRTNSLNIWKSLQYKQSEQTEISTLWTYGNWYSTNSTGDTGTCNIGTYLCMVTVPAYMYRRCQSYAEPNCRPSSSGVIALQTYFPTLSAWAGKGQVSEVSLMGWKMCRWSSSLFRASLSRHNLFLVAASGFGADE